MGCLSPSSREKYSYPLFLITMEFHSSDDWTPFPEFIDPVMQSGFRDDNHVWSLDAPVLMQVTQQGYCLKCFSQSLQEQYSYKSAHCFPLDCQHKKSMLEQIFKACPTSDRLDNHAHTFTNTSADPHSLRVFLDHPSQDAPSRQREFH
jgi:hypothetical protein